MRYGCVFLILSSTLIGSCLMLEHATAQVNVSGIIQTFTSKDRPVRNVTVTNSSDTPIYVKVDVEQATDLLAESTTYAPSTDLLVSPKNLSIGPRGQRAIRLLLKQPVADQERVFRVLLIPQTTEFESGEKKVVSKGGRNLQLQVLTGVGMLIFVEPRTVVTELSIIKDSKGVVISNKGNVQALISPGAACPVNVALTDEEQFLASKIKTQAALVKEKGCVATPTTRLYAGANATISIPSGYRWYAKKRFSSYGEYQPVVLEP